VAQSDNVVVVRQEVDIAEAAKAAGLSEEAVAMHAIALAVLAVAASEAMVVSNTPDVAAGFVVFEAFVAADTMSGLAVVALEAASSTVAAADFPVGVCLRQLQAFQAFPEASLVEQMVHTSAVA
jgi:hypothetical protein